MAILDRYITRFFLINFLILLFVFMMLFIVGDVMIDMDEFVSAGRNFADRFGGSVALATLWKIFDYNGPMSLLLYVFFSGLLVMGAAGFTYAGMTRNSEIVAMVASGVSMYRIAMPVLVAGCVLNGATIVIQEFAIPGMATRLARGKGDMKYEGMRREPFYFAPDGKGNLFSAGDFQVKGGLGVMSDVTILSRDESGRAVSRISASQAVWDGQREGWELTQGYVIQRAASAEAVSSVDPEASEVTFFATDLSPTLLMTRRASIFTRLLSIRQLRSLLEHPKVDKDQIRQVMHSRLSLMVVNVLILAMGLPFFLTREPANLLVQAIKASAMCIGAWAAGLVMQQMGAVQLNPVAGAWLPVVVYIPVCALMLRSRCARDARYASLKRGVADILLPMNRIDQIFKALRGRGGKALMPFLTAGDPDLQTTGELLPALERAGASVCELGIPFSDPIADGPVIQASMTHALSQHIRTSQIFEMVARQRAKVGIGIVAMVSYTIVHRHNPASFIRDAKAAGIDGFIVPDLLLEESQGLRDAVAAEGMICSFLIAPTTPIERAQRIAQASSGFIYLLSRAGITGETTALPPDLPDRVRRLRDVTDLPIAVGFGVSNADQVRQVVSVADAAIVGSAIMRRIAACRQTPAGATSGGASGGGVVAEVERFVTELAGGLRLSA